MQQFLYGTAIEYQGIGILLTGASGLGKSDLALRMIQQGAVLVADDQVIVISQNDGIWLSAHQRLQGLLEIRGIGIVRLPFKADCQLSAVVELRTLQNIDRLPQPQVYILGNQPLPLYHIDADHSSAVDRIKIIVQLQLDQCQLINTDGF